MPTAIEKVSHKKVQTKTKCECSGARDAYKTYKRNQRSHSVPKYSDFFPEKDSGFTGIKDQGPCEIKPSVSNQSNIGTAGGTCFSSWKTLLLELPEATCGFSTTLSMSFHGS